MDVSKPHPARRYNYWLGGKDNFAADRASGDHLAAAFPAVRTAAIANRAFLGRAVRVVAEAGVRQFLDVGTGLPAPGNTHEVAQAIDSTARVLYVDNDPIVMVHSRALTVGTPQGRTAYVEADVRNPEAILSSHEFADTIDTGEPVCLILAAVLHFLPDIGPAQAVVKTLLDLLPAGSYLIASHGSSDFGTQDQRDAYEKMYASGLVDARTRTKDEFATFFDGLTLLDPGITPVADWRPDDDPATRPRPGEAGLYGATGRK